MGGISLPSATNVVNFRLGLFYNEVRTLGYCNLNIYENEEVAFIMPEISRNIELHNIEDKLHCTVSKLHETWLKSSLAIYHYVKIKQLDDICETWR
jgi:hypothetical protein